MLKLIIIISFIFVRAEYPQFYDFKNDSIEEYSEDQFLSNVINSNKASIIEFYANWCGYSQMFIPHWKNFANETKLWQKVVLRVGALDCFRNKTNDICWRNNAHEFPQFLLYHAKTTNIKGLRRETEDSRSEQFMKTTIDFLEKQRHPPREWPYLFPYT